jgi:hypothetical protein
MTDYYAHSELSHSTQPRDLMAERPPLDLRGNAPQGDPNRPDTWQVIAK